MIDLEENNKIKVAVAMSGGVDSSVTAALCVEKYGKENVFGVTMKLFCYGKKEAGEKSCCSDDSISDARAVCDKLGIAHYVIDAEKQFTAKVVDNFVSEYQSGRTPNPCIRCNQYVKFDFLLSKSVELGADYLATGHYARILREGPKTKCERPNKDSLFRHQLLKGLDTQKDQTYFLYNLNQAQLAQILFPVGDLDKSETREIAKKHQLPTAQKTESQEICFVIGETVNEYLKPRVKATPGDIVDSSGQILGRHEGLPFYTIGQRKGLGGGFKEPVYVTKLNPETNQVEVGPESSLGRSDLVVDNIHWISGLIPNLPLNCQAMVRYNMTPVDCSVAVRAKGGYEVAFEEPLRGTAQGQSVVFYDGDICLGGGII